MVPLKKGATRAPTPAFEPSKPRGRRSSEIGCFPDESRSLAQAEELLGAQDRVRDRVLSIEHDWRRKIRHPDSPNRIGACFQVEPRVIEPGKIRWPGQDYIHSRRCDAQTWQNGKAENSALAPTAAHFRRSVERVPGQDQARIRAASFSEIAREVVQRCKAGPIRFQAEHRALAQSASVPRRAI